MDLIQNGESSKSPRINNSSINNADGDIVMNDDSKNETGLSSLILPQWDIPPPRHLHSSQDLISLLHLDTLYNTYVRPYAEINPEDNDQPGGEDGNGNTKPGFPGQGRNKGGGQVHRRRKMEKGYWHLIEDCIDPTPTGTKLDNQSLLPISQDFMHPPGHPPNVYSDSIEMLPNEAFQVAKLEAGHKEDGYSGGIKVGVREAEERRKKKRAAKLSNTLLKNDNSQLNQQLKAIPSPGLPSPSFPYQIPGGGGSFPPQSRPGSTPGTPLLPVAPPQRFPNNSNQNQHQRKSSLPPQSGIRPFPSSSSSNSNGQPSQNQGRPYNPNKRPGSAEVQGNQKRIKSGSVGPTSGTGIPYRPNGGGSRSASPMPFNQAQMSQTGQGQGQGGQGPKKYKPTMRSKTEGVQ